MTSATLACPKCTTSNRSDAKFCIKCAEPLTIQCANCGATNRRTAKFCNRCREELYRKCPNCGRENRHSARYCNVCSAPLLGASKARHGTGALPINQVLQGRYVITKKVAQGGMGAVYQVADQRISGKVWALKEMGFSQMDPGKQLEIAEAIATFKQEAQLLARLSHRNLPRVVDQFEENQRQYLVMDFVQGSTLEKKLKSAPGFLSEAEVLGWAAQLCDVLAYLHGQTPPIVYRDMKPANIMEEDGTGLIKLIDFGIVRFHKRGQQKDTAALGTMGYAPPEQWGKGQTDARSDVYALGVTLHQLLTKYDPATKLFALPPARQLNPAVSPALEQALARATMARMDDRFQTIAELRAALPLPAQAPAGAALQRVNPALPPALRPAPAYTPGVPPTQTMVALHVSDRRLDFGAMPHGKTYTQTLRVEQQGVLSAGGNVTASEAWLHIQPEQLSLAVETVNVVIDTSQLSLGRDCSRPAPNVLGRLVRFTIQTLWLWIGLFFCAVIGGLVGLAILFYAYLFVIPLQFFLWLVTVHARYLVPVSSSHDGTLRVRTSAGEAQVGVAIEVVPSALESLLGWTLAIGLPLVECAVALLLLSAPFLTPTR